MDIKENSYIIPKGFYYANTSANIKYSNRDDMAMIYTKTAASYAGCYTKNKMKAAPVIWGQQLLKENKKINAIVINAGIANAATGEVGLENAMKTSEITANKLNIDKTNVLVSSTGVIGMNLPMDKIQNGIDKLINNLSNDENAGLLSAKAIMTTDTVEKVASIIFNINNKQCIISGMCKGSGMIHPNMGTMLSFISTDVNIDKNLLQKALSETVEDTYNMISVDGDTSTNDSCIVLANGEAGNDIIDKENDDYNTFKDVLFQLNRILATKIISDGEGASKTFFVHVIDCKSKQDAKILSKSVVSSTLTKAAICGADANWGRVICALGYAGVDIDVNKVDIYFASDIGKVKVAENGSYVDFDEELAKKILSSNHIDVVCDMKDGEYEATAYGCDITHKYIDINVGYRS